MKRASVVVGVAALPLLALVLAGCGLGGQPGGEDSDAAGERLPTPHERRLERLRDVCAWAPAFGGVPLRRLHGFDLVVVDGVRQKDGTVDVGRAGVRALRRDGALVLSYLSVGTLERWRHYARPRAYRWALGPVDGWPGEHYADTRRRGWRELMKAEAGRLRRAGFDGLYLDNVDVAEVYPQTRVGVIRLVRDLRRAVPGLLLVPQNGLAVAGRIPVDAIAHEDVWHRWDGRYRPSPPAETRRFLEGLRGLHADGLPVFTLDYAGRGSRRVVRGIVSRSLAEGFHPAVSVIDLNAPPHGIPDCRG